ncbi:DUF2332 family protein [Microbacterium salsuginis]|uniref:DUF2332 family protein n=1 Tax=Microbacterium salsuginis TaxID=2722803 RepID=UPI00197BE15B
MALRDRSEPAVVCQPGRRDWLRRLVWPEHTERRQRLERVADMLRASPPGSSAALPGGSKTLHGNGRWPRCDVGEQRGAGGCSFDWCSDRSRGRDRPPLHPRARQRARGPDGWTRPELQRTLLDSAPASTLTASHPPLSQIVNLRMVTLRNHDRRI